MSSSSDSSSSSSDSSDSDLDSDSFSDSSNFGFSLTSTDRKEEILRFRKNYRGYLKMLFNYYLPNHKEDKEFQLVFYNYGVGRGAGYTIPAFRVLNKNLKNIIKTSQPVNIKYLDNFIQHIQAKFPLMFNNFEKGFGSFGSYHDNFLTRFFHWCGSIISLEASYRHAYDDYIANHPGDTNGAHKAGQRLFNRSLRSYIIEDNYGHWN